MNRLERYIYDRVKFRPRLKRAITWAYQRLFSIIPQDDITSTKPVTCREGFFFGFHDKCPWSVDNQKLLSNRFEETLSLPKSDDEVEIGYFSGERFMNFNPLGRTKTWNWQTGSMLQWVGRSGLIIHNDLNNGQHISRIIDIKGKTVQLLPRPVSSVSRDGRLALSHSFVRLRRCAPEYGYANGHDPDKKSSIPESDGLYLMDTENGSARMLFSIKQIAAVEPEQSIEGAYHYFSHCLFSPTGKRFIFFHRWMTEKGVTWTRMISSNLEGDDLFLFPTSGTVTHTAWRDDKTVLAYASTEELGDHYYLFEDMTGRFSVFGENSFASDGHPQYSSDLSKIVTDTYPDRFRNQNLILYDIEKNHRFDLAKIHSPFPYRRQLRCDLHPRWDRKGTMICFDSAHSGVRALCTMQLDSG